MKEQERKPRAIIIGGSLGGLFAATTLRAAGWRADVFEASPGELDSRGGGIVLQPDVLQALRFAGVPMPTEPGVPSRERIYLDRDDHIVERLHMPQTQTAWSVLYRAMKDSLPADMLHVGETLAGFDTTEDEIVARFESGRTARGELLIGADGIRSTLRSLLMPEVVPVYAGYAAWRGLVPERQLPSYAADLLRERFAFQDGDGHSSLAYLIPGERGEVAAGSRRWNWVWYRRYEQAVLDRLLVDLNGVARPLSLPPGTAKATDIAQLRADAKHQLGPSFRALVDSTDDPFLQAIVDLRAPRMAFGRVVLIGDAAAVPRPHTAGSTAKAAANALSLALALRQPPQDDSPIDLRLARWEEQQLQRGKAMTELGISLGNRLMHVGQGFTTF